MPRAFLSVARCALLLGVTLILAFPCRADDAPATGVTAERVLQARAKGVNFLRTTQADDGSWTSPTSPGITGLVLTSLLKSGVSVDDAAVQKGLQHLESFRHDDGGIYYEQSAHRNYETSIAVMAFEAANADGRYTAQIEKAVKFLQRLQWNEEEGADPSNPAYGGAGYGKSQRPDLSNTSFFLDALMAAGVPADDPSVQNALVFVSRCQNLETAHNTTPFAALVNDGGFYYTPAAGGSSMAGKTPDGGLRSYGSMTYAGLKSMIYAGLTPDDARVKAASDWIKRFYSVDENPGMGQQGLYYYLHTFAKTFAVLGTDRFADADGRQHDWRQEVSARLIALQKNNGSWVNSADRWYEGDPNLVTGYALLAIDYCTAAPAQAP